LSQYLTDATGDLGRLSVTEVTERFVGWCGRPLGAPYRRPGVDRREASCQRDG
jgi:hypothetical protein